MKLIEHDGLRELQADQDKFLARSDRTATYGTSLFLGIYDQMSNYIDVTKEEKDLIEAELLKKQEEETAKLEKELGIEL